MEKTALQLADTDMSVGIMQAPIRPKTALPVPQLWDPIFFSFGIGDSPLRSSNHCKRICLYTFSASRNVLYLFPRLFFIRWLKVIFSP